MAQTAIKPQHTLALTLALIVIARAGYAQDLTSTTASLAIGGGVAVGSMSQAMTTENITRKLQQMGYTNIANIPPSLGGKTFQVDAVSPTGLPVNLTVEVVTGSIIVETPR